MSRYSENGTNAILSAYRLLQALAQRTAEINRKAEADGVFNGVKNAIKFNPGIIRGGD